MAEVTLQPYLFFDGNCREAMEFYKGIFGGELSFSNYEESPPEAHNDDPNKQKDMTGKVMHAALAGGEVNFMASDSPFGAETLGTGKVSLSLGGKDEEKLTKMWDELSKDGKVTQPLVKQFWGDMFGMLTDKYGVDWMVDIEGKKD